MAKHKAKLSRKQRRLLREVETNTPSFQLNHYTPLTDNQKKAFQAFDYGKNIFLHGVAGTGKTFISCYLATKEVLEEEPLYKKIIILRSVVPTRDMGFLPGTQREKAMVYELPYYSIFEQLFDRKDAYDVLKNKGLVEFSTTSFLRGLTWHDSIIIVDESQNLTWHEASSIITRLGDNCRLIFCGDYRQSDLEDKDKRDVHKLMHVAREMNAFTFIEMGIDDIVRSKLVRDFIITSYDLGYYV